MRRWKVVAIATAAAVLAAGASAWALRAARAHRGDAAAHGPREGEGGAPGRQRRLALRLHVELEQPGRPEPLAVTLQGVWVTTVAAVRGGERDVACEVAEARVEGTGVGQAPAADVEALARRLSRRFWVTYRADGTALRLHFPKELGPSDRNLLQMIVTETELVRPTRSEDHWTATERDGAGTYLAVYQRLHERPGEVVKRKLRYLSADPAGASPALPVEVASAEWRFSVEGWEVAGLEGSERIRIAAPMTPASARGAGDARALEIRAEVRLSDARTGSAPEAVGSLERAQGTETVPIGTRTGDDAQAVLARDRRLLDGQTRPALLAAARARDRDPLLPARLAALFRRDADAIPAAAALVRESGGAALVTDALATAGTPAALGALGTLARDAAVSRQARIDALNALVRVPRPGPSEVRVATDLLDDPDREVRRAARLVAGALAYALRGSDPAARDAVESALLSRYEGASAPERADLLDGLGNSAGPDALGAAQAARADGSAEVRVAAARALRRIEDPAADRALAVVLETDRDERVRVAAVRSAGDRWPDRSPGAPRGADDPLVAALLRAASADRSEAVRAGAVGLLRRHQDTGPEIPAALARIAERDPRPGVRRLAREGLADGGTPAR